MSGPLVAPGLVLPQGSVADPPGGELPAGTVANSSLAWDGSAWVERTAFRIPSDGEAEIRGPGSGDVAYKTYGNNVLAAEFGNDAGENLIINARVGVASPKGVITYLHSPERWDFYANGNTAGQKRLEIDDAGVLARQGTLGVRTPAGYAGEEAEWETYHVRTTDASNNDVTVAALGTDQHALQVETVVIGSRDTGDNFVGQQKLKYCIRTGGTPAVAADLNSGATQSRGTGSATAVAQNFSGNNYFVRINGNAGEQWEWTIFVRRQEGGFTS